MQPAHSNGRPILVTGASGYIGSRLISRLTDQDPDRQIRAFCRSRNVPLHVPTPHGLNRVQIVEGDLLDSGAISSAMRDVDTVFHLAGSFAARQSARELRALFDANVAATINTLSAAHQAGVRRVVFASSAAVYGNPGICPIPEETPPKPLSPYGISKLTCELLLDWFQRLGGQETVVLRLFNVYGPGQDTTTTAPLVIPRIVQSLTAGTTIELHGGGQQVRDFVFIDDAIEALVRAADIPAAANRIINIGSGTATSIARVVALLATLLDVPPAVQVTPSPVDDILASVADINLAKDVLGFRPTMSIDEGLRQSYMSLSFR